MNPPYSETSLNISANKQSLPMKILTDFSKSDFSL